MAFDVHSDLTLLELSIFPERDADPFGIDEVGILVASWATVQPNLLLVVLARADLKLLDSQVELNTQLLLAKEATVLIHVILDNVFEELAATDVGHAAPIGPLGVGAVVLLLEDAAFVALSLRDPCLQALRQRSVVAHDTDDSAKAASTTLPNRHRTDAVCRHTSLEIVSDLKAWVHEWCNTLPAADLVVFREVLVQMGLQQLVADKPLAAVGALELDALVHFSDGDDIEFF